MAFPGQKQEAFFAGHVQAFSFFGGVPHRISYDNLARRCKRCCAAKTGVNRSRLWFSAATTCSRAVSAPRAKAMRKGGVEHGVGFGRRNYLVPIPQVASFAELNRHLLAQCQADDLRQVAGQPLTIGAAWALEQPALLPLPAQPFRCCVTKPVCLTPYSQVEFETNRYSVPTDKAQRNLVLRAYPFQVEILYQEEVLASHARSYGRNQDVCDPLHYLPLLMQRPGAFEHAKPLRQWRTQWPPVYEELLARLQAEDVDGQAIRQFVRILNLHSCYPAPQWQWPSRRHWFTAVFMLTALNSVCANSCTLKRS